MLATNKKIKIPLHFLKSLFPFDDKGNPVPNRKLRNKFLENNYDLIITYFFLIQFALFSFAIYKTLCATVITGYWIKGNENTYRCHTLIVVAAGLLSYGISTFTNSKIMGLIFKDLHKEQMYVNAQMSGINIKKFNTIFGFTLIGCSFFLIMYLFLKR